MKSPLEWLRKPPLGGWAHGEQGDPSTGWMAQARPQGESALLGGWGESPEAPTPLAQTPGRMANPSGFSSAPAATVRPGLFWAP